MDSVCRYVFDTYLHKYVWVQIYKLQKLNKKEQLNASFCINILTNNYPQNVCVANLALWHMLLCIHRYLFTSPVTKRHWIILNTYKESAQFPLWLEIFNILTIHNFHLIYSCNLTFKEMCRQIIFILFLIFGGTGSDANGMVHSGIAKILRNIESLMAQKLSEGVEVDNSFIPIYSDHDSHPSSRGCPRYVCKSCLVACYEHWDKFTEALVTL